MPNRAVQRYSQGGSLTAGQARAAIALGRIAKKTYNAYQKASTSQTETTETKGVPKETGVNFGTTFKYATTYQKKKVPRTKTKKAIKKRNQFLWQLMKTQNPIQTIATPNAVQIDVAANAQNWFSLDYAKGADLRKLMATQLSSASQIPNLLNDLRLYLMSFTLNVHLSNTGTQPALVEIFWLVPRYDIPDSDIGASGSIANDFATWLLGRYGPSGDSKITDVAGDSAYNTNTLDASLFHYPLVCRKFKIIKCKKLTMGPGETFTDTNKLGRKIFLDNTDLNGVHYKKGLSAVMAFRCRGFPQAMGVAGSIAQLQISLTESQTAKIINISRSNQAIIDASNT